MPRKGEKIMKKKLCRFLILPVFLFSLLTPGFAREPETPPQKTLLIGSEERFLRFAENCRLDAFSQGLTVSLTRDLDLSGTDFRGIPLFLVTFEGNHHRISGLSLTADGSDQGLFRFLGEGSHVKDLTVLGTVSPEGSRLNVGGIAGSSQGLIESCRFEGTVSGIDRVGGIVGRNGLTGMILNCQNTGTVSGDHFVGGIAGENTGVIRNCINNARVNAEVRDNSIHVQSISLETIAGTEDTNTATDIGGIAGTSIGVIRDSINRGQVGYLHIGYNIGGIAGSQLGYLGNCQNYGSIFGRKEVGGIAGQFEPLSQITYQEDTLQILEQQLSGASSLLSRASSNAQGNVGAIGQGIEIMKESSRDALKAIETLKPGQALDPDTLLAAHNTIKSSMETMQQSMDEIKKTAGNTLGQLGQDLKAVSGQMGAMSKTIRDANENLGIRLSDISDQDTADDLSGKISDCRNAGPVNGDLNTGGIAGSIAHENDLDPEDDLQELGTRSLNVTGSLRAVVLNCQNQGSITCKRLHAGGIVGFQAMGLVRNCVNTGILQAEKAQYVGGIAGSSRGYIRNCSVKCEIYANSLTGGIAGSGTIVSSCLSMVIIADATEKTGAVLGIRELPQDEEVTDPIEANLYMVPIRDIGAIDGISYRGLAEPMEAGKFRLLSDLPEAFRKATLIFKDENGALCGRIVLPIGSVLRSEEIPEIPAKPGSAGIWQDIEAYEGHRVYFDKVFTPEYTPYRRTIASTNTRENGRPLLLAEGSFRDLTEFTLEALPAPELSGKKVLEAWSLPRFASENAAALHFLFPMGRDSSCLHLYLREKDGTWTETEHSVNANHLIFRAEPGQDAFCVTETPDYRKTVMIFSLAGAALILYSFFKIRRHLKNRPQRPSSKK